ncbi:TonB-dependent receptor [Dawidia soli]|uniref:Carboxypeptidase-like regulatory domain-containing protein n=1 Tax=Dawidia soli TaxID=2782352 RepID=A0AAP2GJ65_9BACT|nr:TonB-dependent receptor [Dawidia soli]MBT1689076.1 carboxypeptidase-like regulatory domain-containing protein [Dawidia soli]
MTIKVVMLMVALHVCMSVVAQPCQGVLTGQVLDETGALVAGASLSLKGVSGGQLSDAYGHYRFEALCNGRYTLVVQFTGYKPFEQTVTLTDTASITVRLVPDMRSLQEVVIEEKPLNTEHAHNLAVLNEKQLEETAGKTLGESLKELPGVSTIQTGPGIFKPVIHGVHSQRVLILNYGIRQEGQQWGADHAPEIDPFIASNIVVIKDASAIKYGPDALGGVIVVNPPELPEKAGLGGTFNTVVQSNGRSGTVSGMLEGGIGGHDGWGWRVQGTAKRAGDYHTPDYNLTNTGVKELNFSAAAGYHGATYGIEAFFSRFQTEIGILKGTSVGNIDDLSNAMEREPPQYTRSFGYDIGEPRQEVTHNLFKLNGHLNTSRGILRMQYGFQNNARAEYDIRIGGLSSTPILDLVLNTHTLETEWEVTTGPSSTLCLGATGMIQENDNQPGTMRIPLIPDFTSLSGGAFAIVKFQGGRWDADFGGRYDYRHYDVAGYNSKNILYKTNSQFHNPSFTAGATVRLPHKQSLHLNVSSAWRPPHVAELYSTGKNLGTGAYEIGLLLDTASNVVDINQTDFKVEQALKSIITYRRDWQDFFIEVTPYVNYIFNYIYLRPEGILRQVAGPAAYFRYTQTDALFTGVDITGQWQVAPAWKVTPRASLLRVTDERQHDYLVFIPTNRFDLGVRYEKKTLSRWKDFFVESQVRYVLKQYNAPRTITPRQLNDAKGQGENLLTDGGNFDFQAAPASYALLNVAAGISLPGEKLRYDFRLGVDNVLNTSYREYTNRLRYFADEIGRNFIFSMKCIF